MSKDKFTAKYEVDDGYAGGSRPQSFTIREGDYDFEPSMTDAQLSDLFYEMVDEEMRQKITACNVNVNEFIAWARSTVPHPERKD
jgi:hypothetical protein